MANVQLAVAGDDNTQVILSVPGVQGPTGSSIPPSGTTNQILFKQSNTDYNTAWSFVTNAMVDSSAAIAGTKISPNFGSQNIVTTGTNTAASFIPTSSGVPTNGIYLSAANSISIATNSTQRLLIDSAGQIEAVSLGSAAAPTYSWTGDPSTGIYSPGAYQVAISTNGTGRLFVDASGNVGVGAAPDGQLSLRGANSNTPRFRIQHPSNDKDAAISTFFDGGGTYLLTGSNHYLSSTGSNTKFDATSGSSAWYLDGSGLGIFYNSSGSGSITERFRIRADGTFEIKGGGTSGVSPAVSVNPSASANSLVIDSSGRLLVGTSTAFDLSAQLEVALSGTSNGAAFYRFGADNGQIHLGSARGTLASPGTLISTDVIGSIYFRGHDGTSFKTGATIEAEIDGITPSGDLPSRLVFSTTADGASSPTERMRINNSGQILIGGQLAVGNQRFAELQKTVDVGSSVTFDITGPNRVLAKVRIIVGYTGNASYQMHAQYDYVSCNSATSGATATLTEILQVETGNAQFNYADLTVSRPSNATVRITYAPTSGAGTHIPLICVDGVFSSLA